MQQRRRVVRQEAQARVQDGDGICKAPGGMERRRVIDADLQVVGGEAMRLGQAADSLRDGAEMELAEAEQTQRGGLRGGEAGKRGNERCSPSVVTSLAASFGVLEGIGSGQAVFHRRRSDDHMPSYW